MLKRLIVASITEIRVLISLDILLIMFYSVNTSRILSTVQSSDLIVFVEQVLQEHLILIL